MVQKFENSCKSDRWQAQLAHGQLDIKLIGKPCQLGDIEMCLFVDLPFNLLQFQQNGVGFASPRSRYCLLPGRWCCCRCHGNSSNNSSGVVIRGGSKPN